MTSFQRFFNDSIENSVGHQELLEALKASGLTVPQLVERSGKSRDTVNKFLQNPTAKFQEGTLAALRKAIENPLNADDNEPDVTIPGALSAIAREENWSHSDVLRLEATTLRPLGERSPEDWKKLRKFVKEYPRLFDLRRYHS